LLAQYGAFSGDSSVYDEPGVEEAYPDGQADRFLGGLGDLEGTGQLEDGLGGSGDVTPDGTDGVSPEMSNPAEPSSTDHAPHGSASAMSQIEEIFGKEGKTISQELKDQLSAELGGDMNGGGMGESSDLGEPGTASPGTLGTQDMGMDGGMGNIGDITSASFGRLTKVSGQKNFLDRLAQVVQP
jgi:hypothetical protein